MLGKEGETQMYLQGSTWTSLQMLPDGHCSAGPPHHAKAGVTAEAAKQKHSLVSIDYYMSINTFRTLQKHGRPDSHFV